MKFQRRTKARTGSGARVFAGLLFIGAAAVALAAGAGPSGALNKLPVAHPLRKFATTLRELAEKWLPSARQAPPLLETESRAGKDVLNAESRAFSPATTTGPVVESEPRSGVKLPG
jgi:hypothetical protein